MTTLMAGMLSIILTTICTAAGTASRSAPSQSASPSVGSGPSLPVPALQVPLTNLDLSLPPPALPTPQAPQSSVDLPLPAIDAPGRFPLATEEIERVSPLPQERSRPLDLQDPYGARDASAGEDGPPRLSLGGGQVENAANAASRMSFAASQADAGLGGASHQAGRAFENSDPRSEAVRGEVVYSPPVRRDSSGREHALEDVESSLVAMLELANKTRQPVAFYPWGGNQGVSSEDLKVEVLPSGHGQAPWGQELENSSGYWRLFNTYVGMVSQAKRTRRAVWIDVGTGQRIIVTYWGRSY